MKCSLGHVVCLVALGSFSSGSMSFAQVSPAQVGPAQASPAQPNNVLDRGVGVRKIHQLIGDFDTTLRIQTLTQSKTAANIGGTDLGSTFEHKGRLYFLWGDTGDFGRDTLTYTESVSPWNVTFNYPFASGNQFHPITIPGVASHGGFCIPSGGVSYDDSIYIVYTNQYYEPLDNMETCFMCRSTDDGQTWSQLYTLSNVGADHDMTDAHFINVSMSIIDSAQWPGLPYPGENLLIFGSGAYRKSKLYLAAMPASSIDTKSGLRYLSGFNGSTPMWSPSEAAAISLTTSDLGKVGTQIGEFSAQYIPQLNQWVVLHGYVTICTADQPWGPYSPPVSLWNAWDNDGYGNFLHVPSTHVPPYDSFPWSPDGYTRADSWGGSYGPYLIPRFTSSNPLGTELYFTLSTWNPYRTVLMRAQWPLLPDEPIDPVPITLVPGDASWTRTPGQWFYDFPHINTFTGASETWLSTYGPQGDADVGVMWQWLPRDGKNQTLEFFAHGGDQQVLLLEGNQPGPPVSGNFANIHSDIKAGIYGRVVECMWGAFENDTDSRAKWDLRPFDRANLKVVIIDQKVDAYDFVSVGPMTLTRRY